MTVWAKGAMLTHLLHFWVDNVTSGNEYAPWGITAQLVLRRTNLRFGEEFPKTGGGEDIDLCLRTCKLTGANLKNLPMAKCHHPWWNDGKIKSGRFRGWARGDSLLIRLYPEYCFFSYPNGLELLLFLALGYLASIAMSVYSDLVVSRCSAHYLTSTLVVGFVRDTALIFITDVGYELFRIFYERNTYLPSVQGFERLWCGALGIIFYRLGGADLGHVMFPILMSGSFRHICLRFDWWVGLYPEEVSKTRNRERRFFCIALVTLVAVHCVYY